GTMKKGHVFVLVGFLLLNCLFYPGHFQAAENTEEIDYQEIRIKEFPFAVQCYSFRQFTFMETLQKVKDLGLKYLQPYPGQRLSADQPGVPFNHNLSPENIKQVKEKLRELGLTFVGYGVVPFKNDESQMRTIFDFAREMRIPTIVTEPAFDDFSLLEKMVKEYRINIAIHNHPPPTKYAQPEVVLANIKGLDERIGDCADTGHWMRTGVDPLEALRMLEGRIIDVHLKDLDVFGERGAKDVPYGSGKANIRDIMAELTRQNFAGYITIEYESEPEEPSASIQKGLDYIDSITYFKGYEEILSRSRGRYSKRGWNHYGLGYFVLDQKTGILKGDGGMGLFWYSVKEYEDFILELDFKCEMDITNSGVFIRIPEVVTSDDYIYHSFEIQIDDASEGIHTTGSAYDAEAPTQKASNPTGEWNHFKITFKGSRISVELNNVPVLDWEAEPRGKIRDFASEGYIGLQNHDSRAPAYFRNIFIKELK
ncbi:family 16 glycoside hydrolase, partial [Acidobacteriota bacterium]